MPKVLKVFENWPKITVEKLKTQEKNPKLKEKTENSRWKLKKSALLGSLDAGKASKKKACSSGLLKSSNEGAM